MGTRRFFLRQIVEAYFDMWNTGDASRAAEIISSKWVDHAHPEVTGPDGVRASVERVRAARPRLRFQIDAILGDGDLVAVAGTAGESARPDHTTRLMWLVRTEHGRMTELSTYRDMTQ